MYGWMRLTGLGWVVLLWRSAKAVRGAFEVAAGVEGGKKGQ